MNDIQTVTQNVRLQQWTAIIQARQASGLKVDDYCSEHNISRNAYYYWLRKVKAAAIENSGKSLCGSEPIFPEDDARAFGIRMLTGFHPPWRCSHPCKRSSFRLSSAYGH